MKRVWLLVLVGLVLWSLQDILIWQVIFETDELWQYDGIYHRGWYVMLYGQIVLAFLWTWPKWGRAVLHGVMLYTLAHAGTADVLYYWLRLVPIPDVLPWLNEHPLILFSPVTGGNLIASVAIWLVAWVLVTITMHRFPIPPRASITPAHIPT